MIRDILEVFTELCTSIHFQEETLLFKKWPEGSRPQSKKDCWPQQQCVSLFSVLYSSYSPSSVKKYISLLMIMRADSESTPIHLGIKNIDTETTWPVQTGPWVKSWLQGPQFIKLHCTLEQTQNNKDAAVASWSPLYKYCVTMLP